MNTSTALTVAALTCFVLALLIALGTAIGATSFNEWLAGGLVAATLSRLT